MNENSSTNAFLVELLIDSCEDERVRVIKSLTVLLQRESSKLSNLCLAQRPYRSLLEAVPTANLHAIQTDCSARKKRCFNPVVNPI